MLTVLKAPIEVFISPRSALSGRVSQFRANTARVFLEKILAEERLRDSADVRASDFITSLAVDDFGSKGFGLLATVSPAEYATAAVAEAYSHMVKIGFADVTIKAVSDETPIAAFMRKPEIRLAA